MCLVSAQKAGKICLLRLLNVEQRNPCHCKGLVIASPKTLMLSWPLLTGDPYPIRETMIVDGIGTLIGAILGSPFGTVVYIGHPVHKRVGARTGYSIMNGFIYLILCLVGVIPTILSIIPTIAIGPIIMIFGIMICEGASISVLRCQPFWMLTSIVSFSLPTTRFMIVHSVFLYIFSF